MNNLEDIINDAFENRDKISLETEGPIRESVNATLNKLDNGTLRVCEKNNGEWKINEAADVEKLRCPHCGEHDTVEYVMVDQREKYNRRWE